MMQVGDKAEITRSFSRADVEAMAHLAGTGIGPDVPEPLVAALFSCLLGTRLPGHGTNYLKQDLQFLAPVPLDAPVTARAEVTRKRSDKGLVDLWVSAWLSDGTLICEGRSLVLARGR